MNVLSQNTAGISNAFLKRIVNAIKVPLCYLINRSLNLGRFPSGMKIAKIRALYKNSGDTALLDNYHPISLLPVISKVLEHVIYVRLVSHMERNDIIYSKQFGFRQEHSTSGAFMLAVGEILNAQSDNMQLLSVFVDLRKAFDTVSHSVILAKLERLGIRGVALEWFQSYLSERKQHVEYDNCLSELHNITVGVPQGSLLGVIFFQLHINDMRACLRYSKAILYADDTTIYAIGRNLRALKAKVQADINSFSVWLTANKLSLNANKTKSILFSKTRCAGLELVANGQQIESVTCFKFLGFYLDNVLSFQHHVYWLKKSLNNSLFIIRKLVSFIPR